MRRILDHDDALADQVTRRCGQRVLDAVNDVLVDVLVHRPEQGAFLEGLADDDSGRRDMGAIAQDFLEGGGA